MGRCLGLCHYGFEINRKSKKINSKPEQSKGKLHNVKNWVSKFMFDRPGLPALALTTDTSALTAIGNDYGFEQLFSRQIQALGQKEDVFFAYSTSGTSPNIIKGLEEAKNK